MTKKAHTRSRSIWTVVWILQIAVLSLGECIERFINITTSLVYKFGRIAFNVL